MLDVAYPYYEEGIDARYFYEASDAKRVSPATGFKISPRSSQKKHNRSKSIDGIKRWKVEVPDTLKFDSELCINYRIQLDKIWNRLSIYVNMT